MRMGRGDGDAGKKPMLRSWIWSGQFERKVTSGEPSLRTAGRFFSASWKTKTLAPGLAVTVKVASVLKSSALSHASLTVPASAKAAGPPFADSKSVAAKRPQLLLNEG